MDETLRPPAGFRGDFLTGDRAGGYADASGILRAVPRAAAVPRDAADVATLVRWAAATGTPLVPRGAGTGMPGGNVGPGVVVDLATSLQGVGPIDAEARRATVEPGATLARLNHACAPAGLHFPVDPSSGSRCSLGGMIANNSAGAHSVRYGATRAWVHSLDVVLADGTPATVVRGATHQHPALGTILHRVDDALQPERAYVEASWPQVRKNSSGYALREYLRSADPVDLLVGSEGTLAIVTRAVLDLAPLPTHRGLALLEFTSLEAAGRAVRAILPLDPATCEMLDRTFLELVRAAGVDTGYPLRPGLEAILLVEVEGSSAHDVTARLDGLRAAVDGLAARTSTATDAREQDRLWEVRHAASPLIARRTDGRVSMQFIEDGVVPLERLPDYVSALRRVLASHRLPAVIFGHAGDGNLHVNPLVDVSDPGWHETLDGVLREIARVVAELGGTLSGEHGDGRLRAPLLETVWGPHFVRLFRAVKNAFDPAGILNPGVILPLPGQRPFDALREYPAPS